MSTPPQTPTVDDWYLASVGTSDYFNTCATGQTAVPSNFFGWQQPRTGNAYLGSYMVHQQQDYGREYAQSHLTAPLVAGDQYYVSFWVSLAESNRAPLNSSVLATYQIGAYFTNAYVSQFLSILSMTPQVINPVGSYITDTANWVKIEGTFTAAGGEEWMIIGNFSTWAGQNYTTYANPAGGSSIGYGYYFLDDVCVFNLSSASNIVVHDTAICGVTSQAVLPGRPGMNSYQWNTGATTQNVTINQLGTYWVKTYGECEAWVDTFHVNALGTVTPPELGPDITFCQGNDVTFNVQHPSYLHYSWNTGDTTPSITVTQSGRYKVTVTSGCGTFSDSVNVTVKPQPAPPMAIDTMLCTGAGGYIMLPVPEQGYKWYTSSPQDNGSLQQPRIDGNHAGNYAFFITRLENGCESNKAPVTVTILNTPQVILPGDTALCNGTVITLGQPQDGVNFRWSTGATNCCVQLNASGTYHLTAYNACGEAEGESELLFSDCQHCIWTANAFTPNNDGLNDKFEIKNLCPIRKFQIRIYNRYGQLVFSANNIDQHWDGTYNGAPCDAATYYYYLEAEAVQVEAPDIKLKGDVTLIR